MAFLSVLLAYLLSRYTVASQWFCHDKRISAAMLWLANVRPRSYFGFLAGPVTLSLLLLAVWLWLPFWSSFLCGFLLLLFTISRGRWRDALVGLPDAVRDGKAEALWLMLQSEGRANVEESNRPEVFWQSWCRHTAMVYLDNLFAVFFWFFLLGPAGAVFYRLVSLYCQGPGFRESGLPALPGWLMALTWLPARYMALCGCLAGNFTTGIHVWRQLLVDTHVPTDIYLARCLEAALIQEESTVAITDNDDALCLAMQRHPALQDLLARTEVIGLVGIALAILVLH